MKILCEVTQEKEGELKEGEPQEERSDWWLLHWGLDYTIIEMNEEMRIGVSYTVAICQHRESGVIRCFRPEQLQVLGREIKT